MYRYGELLSTRFSSVKMETLEDQRASFKYQNATGK